MRGGDTGPCLESPPLDIYHHFLQQLKDEVPLNSTSKIISDIGVVEGYSGSNNTTYVTTLAPYCSEPAGTRVLVRRSKKVFPQVSKRAQLNQSAFFAAKMAQMGVGPKIYDMQFTSDHRVIYVMEVFDMDLLTYLGKLHRTSGLYAMVSRTLADQTTHILHTMVKIGMLCSDIKPENTVVRIDATTNMPTLRFIDVDADFCLVVNNTTVPKEVQLNSPIAIQMYMSYLFGNHLYRAGLNFMAEINRTYRPIIPALMKIIWANHAMFSSVMKNYFKHEDVDTFINRACAFNRHFQTEEEALESAATTEATLKRKIAAEEVSAKWAAEKARVRNWNRAPPSEEDDDPDDDEEDHMAAATAITPIDVHTKKPVVHTAPPVMQHMPTGVNNYDSRTTYESDKEDSLDARIFGGIIPLIP